MKLEIHLKSSKTITIGGLSKNEVAKYGGQLVERGDGAVVSIPDWGPNRNKMYSVYRICCRDVEAVKMIAKTDEEKKWLFDNLG